MKNLNLKNWHKFLFTFFTGFFVNASAFASTTSSLPFVTALQTIESAITGPVLLSAGLIMIVITCLMLAFGEWGEGFRKFINIVLWLGVAFSASSLVTTLFGSGAVF